MEIVQIDTAPLRMMRGHLEMFCPVKPILYKAHVLRGYIPVTSHLKQAGCRLQAQRPHLYPQGASCHRGLLQNEVVQICRQWPLQVTWWNGEICSKRWIVGFQWPKANGGRKKSLYRPAKKVVSLICWMVFENKLLLLGFGHMLIFYNTPSFFDSLLSKSVRVTGTCCTYRRIDFDSVCRTSCSWMIRTLYATQPKLLCYGDNKDEMTTKWALTSHKYGY